MNMSFTTDTLNSWAEHALAFAWPMLWQSSLLIGVLLVLDFALRRRLRPAVLYVLWLVVLVKLVLPPSLALPVGVGWWMRPTAPSPAAHQSRAVVVTYGPEIAPRPPLQNAPSLSAANRTPLSLAACGLILSSCTSLGLLLWVLGRWRQVARDARQAVKTPGWLDEALEEAQSAAGICRSVRLRLTQQATSPALCGLFRPTILMPRGLMDQLTARQIRAILLHELIHLRRGDVWVNCLQTLLQIVYWWHPLVWLANARIRHTREEAVDEAVMVALRSEADAYAPTLLQVARLALNRPLSSLGLVGILEAQDSLKRRIRRLIDFRAPRKTGLTVASALCILAFGAFAVPMGQAPAPARALTPVGNKTAVTNAETQNPQTRTSRAEPDPDALYTRVMRINPFTFVGGQRSASAVSFSAPFDTPPNSSRDLDLEPARDDGSVERLIEFFQRNGVDLKPPKNFFYKPRDGTLMVRATCEDLDILEAAVQALDPSPAQVNITVKLYAIPEELAESVWSFFRSSTQQNREQSTPSALLTVSQTIEFIKKIESTPGIDILNGNVTTLSGRSTQIQITEEIRTIRTNLNLQARRPPGISLEAERRGELYVPEQEPLGYMVQLTPWVSADARRVSLDVYSWLTEFMGCDDAGSRTAYVDSKPKLVPIPLPHYRVREMTADGVVGDGQTLLVGSRVDTQDQSAAKFGEKENRLLLMLTPTTVDPAGNRLHPGVPPSQ